MYYVTCTWGSIPHQVYASATSFQDAQALQKSAIELGYSDAKVMLQSDYRLQYGRYQLANHVPPRPMTHAVMVEWGNEEHERLWAKSSSFLGAMALRNAAIEKGFPARVADAKSLREEAEAARRSKADPARAA